MGGKGSGSDRGCDRRGFLKAGAALGAGLMAGASAEEEDISMPDTSPGVPKPEPVDPVRVGFVGAGSRGSRHVKILLEMEGVELRAVCDINKDRIKWTKKQARNAGEPEPEGYGRGPYDFKRMCRRDDLDIVYNSTPWRWHAPVSVAALKAGKHTAVEVPGPITLKGCWDLVKASEESGKHCILLENDSYPRMELAVLNMIHQGVLGQPLHAHGGYMHDLRYNLFHENPQIYRLRHSIARNGNLYPTHGLAPVANCLGINGGDRFDYLVSMSSPSVCLNEYAAELHGEDSPQARRDYACGDVNTTLIRTAQGRTIVLGFNTHAPRPYSRMFQIQGSKGIVRKWPEAKIHIDGESPGHQWEDFEKYADEYEHPIWKKLGERARGSGHGGVDFIENYRLMQTLRTGRYPDRDVYDAVMLSAVAPLSSRSVARNGKPVDFPDFTRGGWKKDEPPGGRLGNEKLAT